jgi:hypothetical protein
MELATTQVYRDQESQQTRDAGRGRTKKVLGELRRNLQLHGASGIGEKYHTSPTYHEKAPLLRWMRALTPLLVQTYIGTEGSLARPTRHIRLVRQPGSQ